MATENGTDGFLDNCILTLRCRRFAENTATALQREDTLHGGSTTPLNWQFTPFILIVHSL